MLSYVNSKFPKPICNHSSAQFVNDGYVVGQTDLGIPYEAEIWHDNHSKCMGIIVPIIDAFHTGIKKAQAAKHPVKEIKPAKVLEFAPPTQASDFAILSVGMLDKGEEEDAAVGEKYVDYFIDCGLLELVAADYYGAMFYRTDKQGNELVEIKIILEQNGQRYAVTNLNYKKYTENVKPKLSIIK